MVEVAKKFVLLSATSVVVTLAFGGGAADALLGFLALSPTLMFITHVALIDYFPSSGEGYARFFEEKSCRGRLGRLGKVFALSSVWVGALSVNWVVERRLDLLIIIFILLLSATLLDWRQRFRAMDALCAVIVEVCGRFQSGVAGKGGELH
ncbi:hypothetical protein Marky_0175 [Marinithermus hydrothermalis DSM 14884]|uniref:Uncharacterized protein n=1 Tax=Marinithermus hydrothermalis (strain DSM 14884 / JCM 11576 / T1) TaxID=869210 RepID=F2NN97_MARHT|nr:hypothetical protein Marky_0175 [Marinithermus hydrothermalis DSM 14884]